jgi:hypothetical protein
MIRGFAYLTLLLGTFICNISCDSNVSQPLAEQKENLVNESKQGLYQEHLPEQQDAKIAESKHTNDNFVGKWQNIENDNEIINLEKKYDNVYQLGGLTLYRKYADDGTIYLSGEFEEYGAEVQVLFDNHTQHLVLRHPADFREYRKSE